MNPPAVNAASAALPAAAPTTVLFERTPTTEPGAASVEFIHAVTPASATVSDGAEREIARPVSSSAWPMTSPYMIGTPAARSNPRAVEDNPVPFTTINSSLLTVASATKVSNVLGSSGFQTRRTGSTIRPLMPPSAFHFSKKTFQRSNKWSVVKVSGIEIPMARMASRSETATPILMVSAVMPMSEAVSSSAGASVTGASLEAGASLAAGASVATEPPSSPPQAATMSDAPATNASAIRDFFM